MILQQGNVFNVSAILIHDKLQITSQFANPWVSEVLQLNSS